MSAFVDLYSALWGAVFGPERYASRKQQDGQSGGFNDDDPRHGFGKGKGELLFQEQRLPLPPPAPVDRSAPFESIAWSIREHQNPINGVRHWDVRHPARPDTTIGAGSSRDFAIQNAKRLWAGGYEFWPEEPEQYAGRRPSAGQLSLFGDDQQPAPSSPPAPAHPQWTATAYRGTGRTDQGSVYKHGDGAVFSDADYFAFTPEQAKRYGPEVQEHQVALRNPRHITNDLDWKNLTEEAGVNGKLGLGSQNPEVMRREADKLAAHLRAQGHDGLVLTNLMKTRAARQIFGHDQVIRFREPETGLVPPGPTAPAGKPARLPPLHVIAEVRDQNGALLGYEHEPHDGTTDGIRAANTALRDRLEDLHPTWSNIATRTGATDSTGHPAWAVSPNSRNVYPAGSREAQDLLGWTSTPRPKLPG